MTGISYQLGLDASPLKAGLISAENAFGALNGHLGTILGLGAGLLSVGAAAGLMKKALDSAAQMQGFEVGFSVLLGSVNAAHERMQDLAKFAADTPFELPEVAAASRTLETLTKGALSTSKGLTLVGDVAAGTQQPFSEMAMWIGRAYDGLQNGRPIGEALMRLGELGIVSGDVRAKLEQLQAAGKKGDAVWGVLAGEFGRFTGMMDKQSHTWTGLMSTLSDNTNALFREFGTPLIDALTPMLEKAIKYADQLAPAARSLGESFASAITTATQLVQGGQIGEVLKTSVMIGLAKAGNFALGLFNGICAAVGTVLAETIKADLMELKTLTTPSFWSGLGKALSAAAIGFGAILMNAIGKTIEGMSKVKGLGFMKGVGDWFQASARTDFNVAGQLGKSAAGDLAPVAQEWGEQIKTTLSAVMEDLKSNIASADVFGTEDLKKKLTDAFAAAEDAAQVSHLADLVAQINESRFNPTYSGTTKNSPASVGATFDKGTVVADKLSKIGAFIGGNGGPAGQKAAESTARNTGKLVDLNQQLLEKFGSKEPEPATF